MAAIDPIDEVAEVAREDLAVDSLTLVPSESTATTPVPAEKLPPLTRNRDYMLLWSGQMISQLGSSMSGIVFPLLILALTTTIANPNGNTVIAGFAGALGTVPYLILSLPVGALIDRWNRKRVMVICDACRTLNSASIPIAIAFSSLTVWQLLINAFIEGTFFVFFNIAEVAALPRVVDKRQLPQASAQNEGGSIATNLIGPPLGTFLFQTVGRAIPFVADAISYGVSVISLLFIKTEFQGERRAEERHLLEEIKEGLSWLWHNPLIRFMAFLTGSWNFASSGMFLAIIIIAKSLGASATEIGVMFSIAATGGILGAVLGGQIQKRFTFGQVIITVGWINVLLVPLLLVAPSFIILGIILGLMFMLSPIYNVVQFSYRLTLIPDKLQGRVNSAFRLLAFGFQPLGAALSGILIAAVGPTSTVLFFLSVQVLFAILTTINSYVRNARSQGQVAAESN
jgi:predicted MFS family arabinose efflux permease